ncbi:hypothetical protein IMCC20628_03868 [Hoeflea sp. IMCC20628]|uniref:hypothetical protein n=1 Tax=Hoeflea sp. IMCC20628 TaxID=1620421 RepID=UPI00063AAAC7|nr:hypothetical protein [Hoeflea sp. IMCC20628]AKI02550.1 hypothetical protein IMCC20628_03868 [Hoeflea sp. IMCC20628]
MTNMTALTPEDVSAHQTLTQKEKINRLSDMKFELERQTRRGTADLDQVEARMASINLAMDRVKKG